MLPVRSQPALFLVPLLVAILGQRAVGDISVLQSVVYFTPVYIPGKICSLHRQAIHARLSNREWCLLLAAASLAMLQVLVQDKPGNNHKPPLHFDGFYILLLQEICLCLFFRIFLQRFEQARLTLLQHLASGSFAIHFPHAPGAVFSRYCTGSTSAQPPRRDLMAAADLVYHGSQPGAGELHPAAGCSRSLHLIGWQHTLVRLPREPRLR